MKKLMILGASILQLPAIIKAKAMGLQVIAVDMDERAVGFKHADICLEVSTIDVLAVVQAARKYKIDGILTLASDMPMQTVAVVSKELNLAGIDEVTAFKATNKFAMRNCLRENHVPIPRYYCVKNIDEYKVAASTFDRGFVVKPVDNSGSRGVSLVEKEDDSDESFLNAKKFSRTGEILLEEYMQGPEVSVETLAINGVIHVIAITDKVTSGVPHFIEMGHSIPSRYPINMQDEIESVAISAIKAIGIDVGPSHTEIIITSEGPKIVELGARLGGDNITTHLVPLATGMDMVKATILLALGEDIDVSANKNRGAAIRYIKSKVGIISSLSGLKEARDISGVEEVIFFKNLGYKVPELGSSNDRLGYIISSSETAAEAIYICETAMNIINIGITPMF